MVLDIFFPELDTFTELYLFFSILCFILFCVLVHSAYKIKIMIQFYFERDGGIEWEKIKNAKNRGWDENSKD